MILSCQKYFQNEIAIAFYPNDINMFLKGYPLEAKTAPKNWN